MVSTLHAKSHKPCIYNAQGVKWNLGRRRQVAAQVLGEGQASKVLCVLHRVIWPLSATGNSIWGDSIWRLSAGAKPFGHSL